MNLPVYCDRGLLLDLRKHNSLFQVSLSKFCLIYFDSLYWVNLYNSTESSRGLLV